MESFRKLGLSPAFIKKIEEAKFIEPSEIQDRTIPLALAGNDIIGGSATGSGKTLAFAASIIEKSEKGKGIQALILTPTRELAEQVGKVFIKFSLYKNLKIAIVYGGVGISPQIDALERAEIVVGTPGRILDHLQRGSLKLKGIKTLVLDEADRMLDMGFIEDVEKIISLCPKQRQTMLFSATISSDIEHIAKKHMNAPKSVEVESYIKPELLRQVYYDVQKELKFSLLVHLLKGEKSGLVMVFCNTRHNTDFVARNLELNEIDVMAIHGGLSQQKRNRIMEKFHSKNVYVLVCTDVAARGLDIKGVSHVYNYDIPPTSKEYIHRIGRTARAGKEGIAISIVSARDYDNFRNVLKDPDLHIEQEKVPENFERAKMNVSSSSFRDRGNDRRGGDRERGGFSRGRRDFGHRSNFSRGGERAGNRFGSSNMKRNDGSRSFGFRDRNSRFGGNRENRSFGEQRGQREHRSNFSRGSERTGNRFGSPNRRDDRQSSNRGGFSRGSRGRSFGRRQSSSSSGFRRRY